MKIRKPGAFGAAALALALLFIAGSALALGGPTVDWWVISGGGAPSSGTGVTLNDTLGQPIVGSSSGGSVTLHAGYWPCNLPAAVSDVTAAQLTGTTDVQLTWSGTGTFDVWRGNSFDFAPGATGSLQIGNDVTSPFTAASVLGNPTINYTFLVLAQNGCGTSGPSNRTAEFDFSLTPGSP